MKIKVRDILLLVLIVLLILLYLKLKSFGTELNTQINELKQKQELYEKKSDSLTKIITKQRKYVYELKKRLKPHYTVHVPHELDSIKHILTNPGYYLSDTTSSRKVSIDGIRVESIYRQRKNISTDSTRARQFNIQSDDENRDP